MQNPISPALRNRSCVLPSALLAVAMACSTTANAGTGGLLYDQAQPGDGGASPTQQMSFAKDEIADDFDVPDSEGWTVTGLKFVVNFVSMNGNPDPGQPPYLVAFYPDNAGMPAATALCEYDAAPGTTDASLPGGEINVSVVLPTPCTLPQGRYWLAMSVVLEPPVNSLWNYVATPDAPGILSEPVYRNPDDHWGTGCVEWTRAYSSQPPCLVNFSIGQMPNMMFQVFGNVGGIGDEIFANGFDS